MPQINKGGKFIFGWSLIKNDCSIQIPSQAIQEYDICSEGKVYLITGSKATGGLVVSRKGLLEKSIFNNVFLEYPDLGNYKTRAGDFFQYKGRKYSWLNISKNGELLLNENILHTLSLEINDKLLSIRSSDITFTMGAKGLLVESAINFAGNIEVY